MFSGFISWEELVGTYGCTIRRLQVGMHPNVAAVAKRMFMIPLTSCDTASASRMVRDVSQAMDSEFFSTQTAGALPCPRDSSFLYFFLFLLIFDSHQLLSLFWRLTLFPYPWAYRNHTSIRRLFRR